MKLQHIQTKLPSRIILIRDQSVGDLTSQLLAGTCLLIASLQWRAYKRGGCDKQGHSGFLNDKEDKLREHTNMTAGQIPFGMQMFCHGHIPKSNASTLI